MEYTNRENEMLMVYGRARLDGLSRIMATACLWELGYEPTHSVLEAITAKYIFATDYFYIVKNAKLFEA